MKSSVSADGAASSSGFGTRMSKHSLPKFKRVDDEKRTDTARLQKRMANIKKKMEELCVLCDTKGFLISYSPPLGVETWPENRDEVLSSIRDYVDINGQFRDRNRGEGSQGGQQSLPSLLAVVRQEEGEQAKVAALIRLMCGDRDIEGMNLVEVRDVISRTDSAIAALNGVLDSFARGNTGTNMGLLPSGAKEEKNLIETLGKGMNGDGDSNNEHLDLTLSL